LLQLGLNSNIPDGFIIVKLINEAFKPNPTQYLPFINKTICLTINNCLIFFLREDFERVFG